MRRLLAALSPALTWSLAGCDEGPPRVNHWMADATASATGQIGWLFLSEFETADDCDHAARYQAVAGQTMQEDSLRCHGGA